jgi:magnesium-transporting ATPase (P-type)
MSGFFWILLNNGWTWGQQLAFADPVYMKATSMVFAGIVMAQMGNLLGCQTSRTSVFEVGIFKNKWILRGIVFSVTILLAIIYIPPLQGIFKTAALGLAEWLYLISFVPIMFLADELRKYFIRKST